MRDRRLRYLPLIWMAGAYPLTLLGYGSDPDAWRLARAAGQIWRTKQYVVSRTTGFPLFELMEAPLVHWGGWYLANLLPLLFGMACLVGLLRLARAGQLRSPGWTISAFAFYPLLLTSSTSAMDYIPALALLVWSYVLMLERKWMWSAILVGLAVGLRPSSVVFIIPVCVYAGKAERPWVLVPAMLGVAMAVGLAAYSPALFNQGVAGLYGTLSLGFRDRVVVAGYNGLRAFGILQTALLTVVLVWLWIRAGHPLPRRTDAVIVFHAANTMVWLALFAIAPYEAEYLLPVVFSLLMVGDRVLDRRWLTVCCIIIWSYNLVQVDLLGGESGRRHVTLSLQAGMTIRDLQDREFKLATRRAATDFRALQPTVLMYGEPWIPTLNEAWTFDRRVGMYGQKAGRLYVSERILDRTRLQELKKQNFRVVAWRGEQWEYFAGGASGPPDEIEVVKDLAAFFGTPLAGRAINQH